MDNKELRKFIQKVWTEKAKEKSIFDYAFEKDYQQVKEQLMKGTNIDFKLDNKHGITLLHIACKDCDNILFEICKQFKANPNIPDRSGQTPIFLSVENKDMRYVKELVDMGADIKWNDNNGSSVLYWGIYSSSLEVLEYLRSLGAKLVTTNVIGRTPLIKAAYLCKYDVMKWLLGFEEVKDTIFMGDKNERNVIHSSCWGPKGGRKGKLMNSIILDDSPECLEYLLDM